MLFNEFIQKNPTFWTDNFPTLPAVVTSVIEDWFYYRELCSEKRFNVYFRAKMNVKLDEFLTLYNKELEFRGLDPYQIEKIDKTINTIKNNSIEDILESIRNFESSRLETRDVTNLNTKALQDKTTLDLTNTNTKDLTNTETLNTEDNLVKTGTETTENNNTYSNTDTKSGSDTSETANTGTTTTKNTGTTTNVDTGTTSASNKFSDYPQSDLNTLTDYLSNQSNVSETYEKNSSNTDDTQTLVTLNTNVDNTASYNSSIATTGSEDKSQTVTNNLTDTTTRTGTVTNKQTGTDVNAQTGTNTVDKTGTDTNKETGTVNNNYTSNSNLDRTNNKKENGTIDIVLSQLKTGNFLDLYRKYFTIITTFNAVDWLLEELDSCFIQVFDEEDEECCELSSCSDLEKKIEDLQAQVNQLNTRVTDLEEGGAGGGVSKEYVDNQISTVNEDISTLQNLSSRVPIQTIVNATGLTPATASIQSQSYNVVFEKDLLLKLIVHRTYNYSNNRAEVFISDLLCKFDGLLAPEQWIPAYYMDITNYIQSINKIICNSFPTWLEGLTLKIKINFKIDFEEGSSNKPLVLKYIADALFNADGTISLSNIVLSNTVEYSSELREDTTSHLIDFKSFNL